MKKHHILNVVDLFSGCGGLSYGFLKAGYNVVLGVDFIDIFLKTFETNHPNAKTLKLDLGDDSFVGEIEKSLNNQSVDVIVAGPPCQGFSLTGPRNLDDPRNRLFMSVYKLVLKLKPKAFLIENVPGMATLYGGQIRQEIIEKFENIEYQVNSKVLLAAEYGVPQFRKRLVYVGIRNDLNTKFEFPTPTNEKDNYITCEDALGDLPSRQNDIGVEIDNYDTDPKTNYQKQMRESSTILHNHVASIHSKKVVDVISLVPEGGNYKDLPDGVGTHRKFHVAWTRYHSKKPSNTIDTGHRNHFHYKWNRVPTVRENARLQSFPDNFIFLGSKTDQNRQIGNAVPPKLSEALAKEVKKYIK